MLKIIKHFFAVVIEVIICFLFVVLICSGIKVEVPQPEPKEVDIYITSEVIKEESQDSYKYLTSKINGWCLNSELQSMIYGLATYYKVDPYLLMSIAYIEGCRNKYDLLTYPNNYGVFRLSAKRDLGYLKGVTRRENVEDLMDPWVNIEVACYKLQCILNEHKEELEKLNVREKTLYTVMYFKSVEPYQLEQIKSITENKATPTKTEVGQYAIKVSRTLDILVCERQTGLVEDYNPG